MLQKPTFSPAGCPGAFLSHHFVFIGDKEALFGGMLKVFSRWFYVPVQFLWVGHTCSVLHNNLHRTKILSIVSTCITSIFTVLLPLSFSCNPSIFQSILTGFLIWSSVISSDLIRKYIQHNGQITGLDFIFFGILRYSKYTESKCLGDDRPLSVHSYHSMLNYFLNGQLVRIVLRREILNVFD